ncbi:hypothetical protein [Chloroflexus sp.]|uniref:hypothetical protein n=1 Tax=Chloroflexus sp. TaxID=1904827 RepID=UPI002ACE6171|nr:hypothetical protein [Chloroflexus sp.]
MSLTRHLQRTANAVRRFFNDIIDDRAARRLVQQANDQAVQAVRRQGGPILVPDTIPTLAGAAFDFGFRAFIQPFTREAPPRVAIHGARNALMVGWPTATKLLAATLHTLPAADPLGQARRFVALAVFERFYRDFGSILAGPAEGGHDLPAQLLADPPITLGELLARMPDATVRDVAALLKAAQHRWAWMRDLPFVPNPNFPLSAEIGGADADWVSGNVLYECKVSYQNRPVEGKHLRQLLGYLLLDTNDALGLQGVALLLPRQREHIQWEVAAFLRQLGIAGELPDLRTRFAAVVAALPQAARSVERLTITDPATGQEHRVIRVRVTQRRPADINSI